jgi:2-C-methyl-D-erythritol 4-phosphate cytidylyltransferase
MNVVIIPAAGTGKRLGSEIPKQFLPLAGVPIIFHTINRFSQCKDIDAIIVALAEDEIPSFGDKTLHLVPGGKERSDSIKNALQACAALNPEIVVVHDAVRPFVTAAQISAVIARAKTTGAAILALPSTDTLKEVKDGFITKTLDRKTIFRAQTPQAFRYELLLQANEQACTDNIASELMTDDSLLIERLGVPIAIVEGTANNIKITTPEDLRLAGKLITYF